MPEEFLQQGEIHSHGGRQIVDELVVRLQQLSCDRSCITKITCYAFSKITNIRMIIGSYCNVVCKYGITDSSHTCTSFSSMYKHGFRIFVRMYLEVANVLLCVKTNVLSFDGVPFTDESLLLLHNACINSSGLPSISFLLRPYSAPSDKSITPLRFNPNTMIWYMVCTKALYMVRTNAVTVLLMEL